MLVWSFDNLLRFRSRLAYVSDFLSLECLMYCRRIAPFQKSNIHILTGVQLGGVLFPPRFFLLFLAIYFYDLKTLGPGRWGGSVPDQHFYDSGTLD